MRSWSIVTIGLLGLLAVGPALGQKNTPSEEAWVTNGIVYAISADMAYIGGDFSFVGPHTGSAVPIDTTTGQRAAVFPKVRGDVYACVTDGSGGWYIGGLFTEVGGVAQTNLAHILSDGSLDLAWSPSSDNAVYALATSGTMLYVGGEFTTAGGQSRNRIAQIDASGNATTWNPGANAPVRALWISGTSLYVGGGFTTIGGQPRNRIAEFDTSSGNLITWDPNANAMVRVIRVIGTRVYVGGDFTAIGGQTRDRIAALDPSTGLAYSDFNPGANGAVHALATLNNILLCGGSFTTLGGQPRNRIAAIDAYWASPTYGDVTAWDPDANATVRALRTTGSNIYVGGDFTTIGGAARNRIAAFDSAPGAVTSWDPNAENSVYALAVSGSMVYAGGTFKIINGKERHNIAELDSTGVATSWNPNANNIVYGLAVSGDNSTVYAGGMFTSIGGAPRNAFAALSSTTGLATAWDPNPNSVVFGVAVSPDGSTVYAGGSFSNIGGATRYYLAALNAATANATPWDPNPSSSITGLALSGDGLTVYARGYFTTVGGQARNGLAALSATTGLATAWNPNPNNTVSVLSISGSTVYAGGSFSSIGGQARKGIAALSATTGLATPWDPNPSGGMGQPSITALAVSGGTVYVGGMFIEISGQTRLCLAGIDTATGLATAWNPPSTALVGCIAMAASGSTVVVGGMYEDIAGEWRPNLARFEAVAAPSNPCATSIGLNTITWTWQDNSSDETGFKVYDDPGAGDPVTLRTTTAANVESWQHNGLATNSQYAFQVAATNALGDSMPTNKLIAWTLIQAVSGFTFSNITPNSITVASANTPSNLSSGASGLYFANTTAGTNSGWKQNMTPWTSAALTPNTPYTFSGQSRNGAGLDTMPAIVMRYTLAATPLAPALSNPTEHSLDVAIAAGDGNPSNTPYAIRILPPIQGNVWVQANGSIGAAPVYRTAASWATMMTVTGLAEYTLYAFVAIARNGEGIETALASPSVMMTTDGAPPTVTMSSFTPDPTNMNPIPVMVVFSEVVTGFTGTDIVAGNGTMGGFVDLGGRIYTFNLTPLAEGLVTADIAADVAIDVAGHGNVEAPQFSRTLAAPTIMLQPAGGSAYVGDSFAFTVAASGGVAPLSYQWRLNGSDIGGATNITLVRSPLVLGDTGGYTCVVTNSGNVGNTSSQTATLNVAEHLVITTQPISQTRPEGWPYITFLVEVSGGIGPISYQWRRDGMDLTSGDQSTYTIPLVQVDHQGSYTCLVTDEFNNDSIESAPAILTVLTGITVPATSGLALAALLSTCLLAGGAILRKKK